MTKERNLCSAALETNTEGVFAENTTVSFFMETEEEATQCECGLGENLLVLLMRDSNTLVQIYF